jgi:hypothetical protein
LQDYKELAKWENGLGNEYRLKMTSKLEKLRGLIFFQESEATYSQEQAVKSKRGDNDEEKEDSYVEEAQKYRNVDRFVDEWHDSLVELKDSDVMPYEKAIVKEIDKCNRRINANVQVLGRPENVVLLEGLTVDSFSGTGSATGGTDKRRFLYNEWIKKTRPLIVNKYEKDILDSEGFDHHPELQMLPLSIKEVRYEVYEVISARAKKGGDKIGSRGNFFFVGLGGGTGTGVISPLAEQFGKGSRGYFTLGLLGGKGDKEYMGSQQPWFRRCFNMLLALNDLIVTANLNGIILVDNEVLIDRLKGRGKLEEQVAVSSDRNDFNKFLKDEFGMDWVVNAEIARSKFESDGNKIYHIYDAENFAEIESEDKGETAILKISDGRIYDLNVKEENGKRKIHGKTLAEKIDEELTKIIFPAFGITACEKPGSDIDWAQLKGKMELEQKQSPIFVPCYASDKNKTTAELIEEALDKGKLADCGYRDADKIIGYVRDIGDEVAIKKIFSEHFNDTFPDADIKIIKGAAEKDDVLSSVRAKIIVFESKTTSIKGEYSGKNEVLLLLRNCDVKDTLYNRLKVAQSFVDLLDEFKNLIKNLIKEQKNKQSSTEQIAREIIKTERDKLIAFIEVYLFSWDNVINIDEESERLLKFLTDDLDVDWANDAKIRKRDDDRTILIVNGENTAEIMIDDKNEKATLKIKDVRKTDDLKVKKENGKLNIYKEVIPTGDIAAEYLFSWDKVQDVKVQDDKKEAKNKQAKNKLMESLRKVFNIDWAEDLKINSTDNEIICKPTAGGGSEIKIEKGVDGTAESENRAVEKILQEAKSFLLPKEIGPQKMEETYKYMIEIVDKLKVVVNGAINNLDAGITPIFTDPIFKPKSAVTSDAEVNLTLMCAMGEDTYSRYHDALGGNKVDQLFDEFQRETLEDWGYVENNGDTGDYTLSNKGESALEFLEERLDEVPTTIERPSELLGVIGLDNFLEFVKDPDRNIENINFPKLLVLSLVYIKNRRFGGDNNLREGE